MCRAYNLLKVVLQYRVYSIYITSSNPELSGKRATLGDSYK
jgi:hypothetical protein